MKRLIIAAALGIAALPAAAGAQETAGNRFRVEPYAGALLDSYDISPDGENTAPLLGLRLGYALGERSRLTASLGWASTRDVSDPSGVESHFVYGNRWVLTTAGAEYDLIPGATSVSLGVEAGVGWRRIDREGERGSPEPWQDHYSGGGFSAYDVVVPGITLRHALSERLALSLGARDHLFDVLEGPVDHSPGLTLGVTLR